MLWICLEHEVFTPCVDAVVFGFHSPIDEICPDHLSFSPDESRRNFMTFDSYEDVFRYLIDHFSNDGDTILDMTQFKGMLIFIHMYVRD